MGIRNYLLFKLTGGLPCRLIKPDDQPYLERYYVCTVMGRTYYLHRFVSADAERHMHNHPFDGTSVVLAGSYTEEVATDICAHAGRSGCVTESHRVRWFNSVPGSKFHRIRDAEPGTWTLFSHGPRLTVNLGMAERIKGWGFLSTEYVDCEQVTLFKAYPSGVAGKLDWWADAETGDEIGRVPL